LRGVPAVEGENLSQQVRNVRSETSKRNVKTRTFSAKSAEKIGTSTSFNRAWTGYWRRAQGLATRR